MRPLKLSICGVKSFSSPAQIDFECLTQGKVFGVFGKTGAGKSAIVDSLVFALYGEGGVSNTDFIHNKSAKAEIELTFSSTDEHGATHLYRVKRTLKRQKSTTPKADAELFETKDGKEYSIAVQTEAVNKACEGIVGLSHADFKQCIVLSQGQYARFIRAQGADRKKIVVRLFGLKKYGEELHEKVKISEANAGGELTGIQRALEQYDGITEENVARLGAELQVKQAQEMQTQQSLRTAQEVLRQAEQDGQAYTAYLTAKTDTEQARVSYEEAVEDCKRKEARKQEHAPRLKQELADIEAECNSLKERIAECNAKAGEFTRLEQSKAEQADKQAKLNTAREKQSKEQEALTQAQQTLAECKQKRQKAEAWFLERGYALPADDREAQGAIAVWVTELNARSEEYRGVLAEKTAAEQEVATYTEQAKRARLDEQAQKQAFEQAKLEWEQAQGELDEARLKNAVAQISATLHEGDDCPVCGHRIDTLAVAQGVAELKTLEAELARKAQRKESAEASKLNATNATVRAVTDLENATEKLAKADQKLAERNLTPEIKNQSIAMEEFKNRCNKLFECIEQAQLAERTATNNLTLLAQSQEAIEDRLCALAGEIALLEQECYTQGGKSFAEIKQEAEQRENLLQQQKENVQQELSALERELITAQSALEQKKIALDNAESKLTQHTVRTFDEVAYADKKTTCERVSEELSALHDEVLRLDIESRAAQASFDKVRELLQEQQKWQHRFDVLSQLSTLTSGNKFANWIAESYIQDFTHVANELLLGFTGGEMGLVYNGEAFMIVDYFNGGDERKVDTISGGETFLVSLSVAIAVARYLGERVGAKSTDFMFIDEGFGTLSQDKIDVVLDAINSLAQRGVVVGLISHVAEMRAQVPCKLVVERTDEKGSICYTEGC